MKQQHSTQGVSRLRALGDGRPCRAAVLAAALGLAAVAAQAHGDAPHRASAAPLRAEQKDWGIAGNARAARRTIQVTMNDAMRFSPERIQVRLGETVTFVIRNRGRLLHEFVLGTPAELDAHAALMAKFPDMEHDEPYMAHVPPARSGRITWTFNRPGSFAFACLIAGHHQAGMVGTITVTPP